MALTDESNGNGFYMPVAPAYGGGYGNGGGFGGDWFAWLILAMLLGGGWGMGGFGGGWGGMMGMGFDFPWLLTGQQNISNNTNDGFRDQMLQTTISSVGDKITAGFGDVQLGIAGVNQGVANAAAGIQQSLCSGFAGTTAAVTGAQNAITQQLYNNEIASLNRSFAEQTANAQGFNGVQAGIADLRYTEATEACATRTASAQNTRDIIDAQTRGTQAILDKLCALELDGVKGQLAQAQRENVGLQNQINMMAINAAKVEQTAQLRENQAIVANQLVSELRSCPIPAQPVYGNQPIFTCSGPQWNNNGCGCGGGFVA